MKKWIIFRIRQQAVLIRVVNGSVSLRSGKNVARKARYVKGHSTIDIRDFLCRLSTDHSSLAKNRPQKEQNYHDSQAMLC